MLKPYSASPMPLFCCCRLQRGLRTGLQADRPGRPANGITNHADCCRPRAASKGTRSRCRPCARAAGSRRRRGRYVAVFENIGQPLECGAFVVDCAAGVCLPRQKAWRVEANRSIARMTRGALLRRALPRRFGSPSAAQYDASGGQAVGQADTHQCHHARQCVSGNNLSR